MQQILDDYESRCDFIYLFANDTVHDFYPKFGFQRVMESSFSLESSALGHSAGQRDSIRRLDLQDPEDQALLQAIAASRVPVSSKLGVVEDTHLVKFYSTLAFPDDYYYVQNQDAIVLFKHEEEELHLFDILSRSSIEIEPVLACLVNAGTKIIHFHFAPDAEWKELQVLLMDNEDDALFVKSSLPFHQKHLRFPVTSHA